MNKGFTPHLSRGKSSVALAPKKGAGFTLIGLMTIVAVVALILAVALTSRMNDWQQKVEKPTSDSAKPNLPLQPKRLSDPPDKVVFKAAIDFYGQTQYWLFVDNNGQGQWQLVDQFIFDKSQIKIGKQ